MLSKFNLLLLAVYGLGLALIAAEARGFLQRQAQAEVVRQAGLISASASAVRNYTEHDVTPLLETTPAHAVDFLPQTISFFAARKTVEPVRAHYPVSTYKEAALNPTNLRDRANGNHGGALWILNSFGWGPGGDGGCANLGTHVRSGPEGRVQSAQRGRVRRKRWRSTSFPVSLAVSA